MGQPMAARLAQSGVDLAVWTRTRDHADEAVSLGAAFCDGPDAVFARGDQAVLLMLADEAAVEAVLHSGGGLAANVRGRCIVNLGTYRPDWSADTARKVEAAGGDWVEAPVSGSRGPAEAGELVAMLAGRDETLVRIEPLIAPLCRRTFV